MSKYDEFLDLLVEYFNHQLKYYDYNEARNNNTLNEIIEKIKKISDDKRTPAFKGFKVTTEYLDTSFINVISNILYNETMPWLERSQWDYELCDGKSEFYKINDKLFFKIYENNIICELNFKKFAYREDQDSFYYLVKGIDSYGILLSANEASNVLGTPVFGIDKTLINNIPQDFLQHVKDAWDSNNNVYVPSEFRTFLSFVTNEFNHNALYNVNTPIIQNLIQDNYNPNEIFSGNGVSYTIYLHVSDRHLNPRFFKYSLKPSDEWIVKEHRGSTGLSYGLHTKDRKKFAVLTLVYENEEYFIFKDDNDTFQISTIKPKNIRSDNLYNVNFPKNIQYLLSYTEDINKFMNLIY